MTNKAEILAKIREKMDYYNLDGYLIPSNDEFQSEYSPLYAKRIEFLSGFTGSYGFLVILSKQAILFTDSRYITQAEKQLDESLFSIHNISDFGNFDWPLYSDKDIIDKKLTFGLDPNLFTKNQILKFKKIAEIQFIDDNLVDIFWPLQPKRPATNIWEYDEKYTGKSVAEKLVLLRDWMKSNGLSYYLISSPESICWLLNIRASDCEFNTVALCYGIITHDEIYIFSEKRNWGNFYMENLFQLTVEEMFSGKIFDSNISIGLDEEYSSLRILDYFKNYKNFSDPCILWKSCKNDVEIEFAKKAHIKDATALCEFLAWLEINHEKHDEYEIGNILTSYRKKQGDYVDDSFPSICGFKSNGAIIHYRAEKNSALKIEGDGLLLIDSGAHYLGGTTDVTRVLLIGNPENDKLEEYKKYYTLVLKGHIAMSKIIFPKGIRGANLDVLARQFLWQNYIDYGHGTGHGVGNCISVHEPPQRVNFLDFKTILRPNMILSNEPGYYSNGNFGIRIENLQYVKDLDNDFLSFEYLTLVPYCKNLINFDMLNFDEIEFLKSYSDNIRKSIMPNLSTDAKNWVENNLI